MLLDQPIAVNGTPITAADIAAEMQHHPADTADTAWAGAARALVVRRLLLDAAAAEFATDEGEAIDTLLAREVHVPQPDEAACRRWYTAHPERFGTPEWWEASHILIAADPGDPAERDAAEARARDMLSEVLAVPGALPDLARRHSDCPSREQGGNLGRMERGSTVPEFETFLAGLAPGQVCPVVVKTRYGMHVVHLHRYAPARLAAFDDVLDSVARDLHHSAWQAAVRQFIAVLAARARIEGIDLDTLGEARAQGPLVN